jgi:endonuclease III related protein
MGHSPRSCQGLQPVSVEGQLRTYYQALLRAWGSQNWWPARTRFEVIVGAFLTQNTSWTNVEKALRSLRAAEVLNPKSIRMTPQAQLESLLRSSGYFRQKALRLKNFVAFLDQQHGGSLPRMFAQPTETLRHELLALHGVGPETADSILLYAGQHPVFVVDAYTRRILARHDLLPQNASYEGVRTLFERSLAPLARKNRRVAGKNENSRLDSGSPAAPGRPGEFSE